MIKLFSKFIYCIHCKNLCTVSMLWVTCLGSRIYLPFRSVVFHVYKVFHVFHLYKDWGVVTMTAPLTGAFCDRVS